MHIRITLLIGAIDVTLRFVPKRCRALLTVEAVLKKRFTEDQIIGVLKEAEVGLKFSERCRKHGISEPTYYNWLDKYASMTVSEAKRLKALEQENNKLKRLLAGAYLDVPALKVVVQRKW